MAYNVSASLAQEQAKLEGSYPIDMIVVNASLSGFDPLYFANINQNIYGYSLNASGNFINSEQEYVGLPLDIQNFSTSTEGKIPEVTVSVPNVDRAIESVIQDQEYLRSREVYLITTYAKFLPIGSDYRYIGEIPDRNAAIKEKFYISAVTSNSEVVTFTCKPKFDLHSAQIPNRRFSKECNWDYGDTSCDPTTSINYNTYPTCNYTLENCEARGNSLRFGGFPTIPRSSIVLV